jgi:hypothetical protein
MYTASLDLTADIIDVRDIIERVEELQDDREDYMKPNRDGHLTMIGADWVADNPEQAIELATMQAILADLKGNGGDEHWDGDWYPVTLIRDSHFIDYAQELCEDIGDVPRNLPHYIAIDWEVTARNIRMDYTPTEIGGVTYWYR